MNMLNYHPVDHPTLGDFLTVGFLTTKWDDPSRCSG